MCLGLSQLCPMLLYFCSEVCAGWVFVAVVLGGGELSININMVKWGGKHLVITAFNYI